MNSRTRKSRLHSGPMGSAFGDFIGKVFTSQNVQTGLQVAQDVVNKGTNGGAVTYNGTTAQVATSADYLNYAIIGAVGLAAVVFLPRLLSHKK